MCKKLQTALVIGTKTKKMDFNKSSKWLHPNVHWYSECTYTM